jgi:predicted transcriptional regulator YdeE
MQKTTMQLPEIKLVGLKVRTTNKAEIDFSTGKIFPSVQKYFQENLAASIPHRKKPGTTLCVYTEYESDHTGEYSYLIGEEVDNFSELPAGLEKHTIAPQTYTKFTHGPAPMPEAVREPWFKIWAMDDAELGGKRRYHADFEVYDERAADHQNIVLDIYIGVAGPV